jgi:hypothetical protein
MANQSLIVAFVVTFLLGLFAGAILADMFLFPEIETKNKEKITQTTTTEYKDLKETVDLSNWENLVDSLKSELKRKPKVIVHEVLRDTIIEGYNPKIQAFRAVFPTSIGNAYLSGEVLGEVLKTRLSTDYKIPVITNTITNEKTITNTVIQKGIFVGGGFSNQMDWHVGASYLGNGFLANVNYTPTPRRLTRPLIQVDIKLNLFKNKK